MDAKEEVRAKLNIEDVIGEYVELKRAGRNFKGLSPFSGEKTASFFVSPEKQIWHDFSSNRGGDVFSFVMEAEGMDFRQALEQLARKAGVDLTIYESKGSQELSRRKKRLLEAHDLAARYFQHCMIKSQTAVEYVFGARKLSKAIVTDFRIGYAPDAGNALTGFLLARGFTKQELSDAGLVNRFGGDLFRGRMAVPLMDGAGQVIGFTGRIIGEVENAPKYLNTPQTVIYDKSRHVFGLSQAKEAIRTNNYAVIVEGNLDVVSSHQVDIRQVVATAGTAMTEHHLRALKRLTSDIRLAFDGDKAGIAAAERAVTIASAIEVDISIVSMPDDAKDPDELIQRDPELWRQAITHTTPAVEWVLQQYGLRYDIKSAEGKRKFSTAAVELLQSLKDLVERDHYERLIAKTLGSSLESVQAKLQSAKAAPVKPKKVSKTATVADRSHLYEDDLLAVASLDAQSQELFTQFDISMLHGEERYKLAAHYLNSHDEPLLDTPVNLHDIDTYVKIVLLRADTRYASWSEQDRYFETARLIRQVENEQRKRRRKELVTKLREAEAAADEVSADTLREQLNKLIKEIARG